MKTFDAIIGKKIIKIEKLPQPEQNPDEIVENILGIEFEDNCKLIIYYPYEVTGAGNFSEFTHLTLTSIENNRSRVIFSFSSNKNIIVYLDHKKIERNRGQAPS